MIGNIIGSLCDKICGSCKLNKFCDFSKNTTVVIGRLSHKETEAVRQIMQNSQGDLFQAIREMPDRVPDIVHQKTERVDFNDIREEIAIAILDVAHLCLKRLKSTHSDDEEAFNRLIGAAALCKIDLVQKFRTQTPLTQREYELLLQKVDEVIEYGSLAAYLWEEVKDPNTRKENLRKLREVAKNQFNILYSAFRKSAFVEQIEQAQFGELSPQIKEVFLSAAKKGPKNQLTERSGYWIKPKSELGLGDSDLPPLTLTPRSYHENEPNFLEPAVEEVFAKVLGEVGNAIYHVFAALKETPDPIQLKEEYAFPEEAIERLVDIRNQKPNFEAALQLSKKLKDLPPAELYILAELTLMFPERDRQLLNNSFALRGWHYEYRFSPMVRPRELGEEKKREY